MPAFDHFPTNSAFYILLAIAAVALVLARRVPWFGRILGFALTLGLVAIGLLVFSQRAAFDPTLARVAEYLKLDHAQEVVGKEMRVPMAHDGHFWVRVKIGAIEQRMLVDSGATITALSSQTAAAAGLHVDPAIFPMIIRTANGSVPAQTARIEELRIGNIVARDLPVVVSPAFGDINVVGMNFLSRLKSWRVEDSTLILQPHHPQDVERDKR